MAGTAIVSQPFPSCEQGKRLVGGGADDQEENPNHSFGAGVAGGCGRSGRSGGTDIRAEYPRLHRLRTVCEDKVYPPKCGRGHHGDRFRGTPDPDRL